MRRSSVVGLIVAVTVILLLALVAWGQWRAAVQQRDAAEVAWATAAAQADLRATAQAEKEAAQQELATRLQELEEQRQCALAWQLLVQAQMALDDTSAGFVRAGLLGVESMRRCPTLEGDQTLRQVLRLLPRVVACVEHEGYVRDVTFSPDGWWIASGSGEYGGGSGEVEVWETATGNRVASMRHEGMVASVAFSPDGRWIASGGHDDTVRVWEASTGREVARVEHGGQVDSVAFSPDGRWVASGSQDGTARVLLWQQEDLMAEMCARLTRNFTVEEWQQYIPGEPYRPTCPGFASGRGLRLVEAQADAVQRVDPISLLRRLGCRAQPPGEPAREATGAAHVRR